MGGKTNDQTSTLKRPRKKINKETIRPLPHTSANSLGWESCPPSIRASMSPPSKNHYALDVSYPTPPATIPSVSRQIPTRRESCLTRTNFDLGHSYSSNNQFSGNLSLTDDSQVQFIKPTNLGHLDHSDAYKDYVVELENPGRSNTRRSPAGSPESSRKSFEVVKLNNYAKNEPEYDDTYHSGSSLVRSDRSEIEQRPSTDRYDRFSSPKSSDIWGSSIDAWNTAIGASYAGKSYDNQNDNMRVPGVAELAALVRAPSSSNDNSDEFEEEQKPATIFQAKTASLEYPRVIARYETPVTIGPRATQGIGTTECNWFGSSNIGSSSSDRPQSFQSMSKALNRMSLKKAGENNYFAGPRDHNLSAVSPKAVKAAPSKHVPSTNYDFLTSPTTDIVFRRKDGNSTKRLRRLRSSKSLGRLKKLKTTFSYSQFRDSLQGSMGSPSSYNPPSPNLQVSVLSNAVSTIATLTSGSRSSNSAPVPKGLPSPSSPSSPTGCFPNDTKVPTTPCHNSPTNAASQGSTASSSFPSCRISSDEFAPSTPLTIPDDSPDPPRSRLSRYLEAVVARMGSLAGSRTSD